MASSPVPVRWRLPKFLNGGNFFRNAGRPQRPLGTRCTKPGHACTDFEQSCKRGSFPSGRMSDAQGSHAAQCCGRGGTGRCDAAVTLGNLGLDITPRAKQTPEALGAHQKAEADKWWPITMAESDSHLRASSATAPRLPDAGQTGNAPLPSVSGTTSAPGKRVLSRLNGWPVRSPVNASLLPSRATAHDSGSMRFSTPPS
jgi:hypothetical protein